MTASTGNLRHLKFCGVAGPGISTRRLHGRFAPKKPVEPLDRDDLESGGDPFVSWLLGRVGLQADLYRVRPMQRRLPACFRALRVASAEEARQKLECRPELIQVAVNALLLGVTAFFRDPPVFSSLRELLEPLARERGPLSVWSVSCSTGCELYSVGMLLAQAGHLAGCRLLGTDCRAEALGHAQSARYAEADVAQLDPSMRSAFFEPGGAWVRVRAPLRSQPEWRQQDVLQEAAGPWDVILWRNTAIYMRFAAAQRVWNRLVTNLRPGGLLVTGKAERPEFTTAMQKVTGCIYRKMTD